MGCKAWAKKPKRVNSDLEKLKDIIRWISLIKDVRIEQGEITTPFGNKISGFKITVGGVMDPSTVIRTYDDIDKIFKANPSNYKVTEHKTADGKFKSYTVETT